MSARDASPPPTARAGLVVTSPELPSSEEDEDDRRVTVAPRASHNPRPAAASSTASQPIPTPSAKEVYLDSDSDMLLLTTWAGRPAASAVPQRNMDAVSAPLRPPALPVSP